MKVEKKQPKQNKPKLNFNPQRLEVKQEEERYGQKYKKSNTVALGLNPVRDTHWGGIRNGYGNSSHEVWG